MATATRKPGKTAELAALASELAYSAARSDIEVTAKFVKKGGAGGSGWYDTNGLEGDDVAWVARAIRYLDLCGSLARDPRRPGRVRVLDRELRG